MTADVKTTKNLYFNPNWGSEKYREEMTIDEALTYLEKVLKTYAGIQPIVQITNDVGVLSIDILTARDRKRFRDLWQYFIFTDVYGQTRGLKKFIEYKETREEEAKLRKELKNEQKTADRANA